MRADAQPQLDEHILAKITSIPTANPQITSPINRDLLGYNVYRDNEIPWLLGTYIYGDFCSGRIWGLRYDGDSVIEQSLLLDSDLSITSFGQGLDNRLYVLSRDDGIYRILPDD